MSNPASAFRITKSALVLGSAVAIAGLVAAAPVQAATSSKPCGGSKTASTSSGKRSHTTTMKKEVAHSKEKPCSTK